MMLKKIEDELKKLGTKERAKVSSSFFKTGKGEYGEGDIFLGVTVPDTRKVVKKYIKDVEVSDLEELIQNKYHEVRLFACLSFVELMKYAIKDGNEKKQKKIFETYIKNAKSVNNWDLVDTSAPQVVGYYISEKMNHEERLKLITKLIESKNLWENRIIVVATYYQIKKGNEKMIFYVAERLMEHKHDLIHKAIGWMLREVGKNCGIEVLNLFLEEHIKHSPRTALRYALEKHDKDQKLYFMNKK